MKTRIKLIIKTSQYELKIELIIKQQGWKLECQNLNQ